MSELPPLCVDLDGTLIHSDLLHETLLAYLRRAPWRLPGCILWLLRGRANLKRQLSQRTSLSVAGLPYNEEVVSWLRQERAGGRRIVLVSAADDRLVRGVAAHLGFFDAACGSDGRRNLKGAAKLEAIRQVCGEEFDYCADSSADLPIWRQCREAVAVNPGRALRRALAGGARAPRIITTPRRGWAAVESLRPLHWVKNLLVFLPLVTAHRIANLPDMLAAGRAFAAFSLVASGIYVINDLVDVEADRMHPRKRLRPFSSGRLPFAYGIILPVILFAGAVLVSAPLPAGARGVVGLYFVLAMLYSLGLKRAVLIDVMGLAILYTLRIVAGHAATGIPFSPWLLSFAVFSFFSLAFCKRASELGELQRRGERLAPGRGYGTEDKTVVTIAGVASGFAACIIFMLYLGSDTMLRLYKQPEFLWLLVPAFLYWICRIWILAGRGEMDDDPFVFALRDRSTYVVLAWCGAWLILASHAWFPPLQFAR